MMHSACLHLAEYKCAWAGGGHEEKTLKNRRQEVVNRTLRMRKEVDIANNYYLLKFKEKSRR